MSTSCLLHLLLFFLTSTLAETKPLLFPTSPPRPEADGLLSRGGKIKFETHFFPQILDHFTFTPQSYRLFNHKYLLNSQFWDEGPVHSAPIFVYTGNEGDIEWFAANTGFMADIAPKFRALLVFIEHRFYGESLPFGKKSQDSAKRLGYLSSTQALADFATLVTSLKQNLSAEASPVVVFGGSYGGMLAAWFRLKYPHITIGALASSAPILYFDDITPSDAFYDVISQDFKGESLNCFETIRGSWDELASISEKKDGLKEISNIFRSCKQIDSVSSAENWLWGAFIYTAMVDYPMEANFLNPLPAHPVREMCRIIDGFPAGETRLSKAVAAARLYYDYKKKKTCYDLGNTGDDHGTSGWSWQACTEMVMPMSVSNGSMFPPESYSFEQFKQQCILYFGVPPRPHWITTEYGGHKIEVVLKRFGSNIIFSNGMRDPWSAGGVLKNISDSIIALVTKEGAHHLDLRPKSPEDPDWLVEQRQQEVKTIRKWIDQYYADLKASH